MPGTRPGMTSSEAAEAAGHNGDGGYVACGRNVGQGARRHSPFLFLIAEALIPAPTRHAGRRRPRCKQLALQGATGTVDGDR